MSLTSLISYSLVCIGMKRFNVLNLTFKVCSTIIKNRPKAMTQMTQMTSRRNHLWKPSPCSNTNFLEPQKLAMVGVMVGVIVPGTAEGRAASYEGCPKMPYGGFLK